ncbi:MAG: hypothetical protein IJ684_03025 [Bacteroidales bacterium]|nr:hypothetical protein [Bacteroidales bacterium]
MEQRLTERVNDTVREQVVVFDTVGETVRVFDTLRETTTIQLGADGDTIRKETEREHVSDRTRERASASQREATSQQSHEEERTADEKQTTVEQPKRGPVYTFFMGMGIGVILALFGVIILIRLIEKSA